MHLIKMIGISGIPFGIAPGVRHRHFACGIRHHGERLPVFLNQLKAVFRRKRLHIRIIIAVGVCRRVFIAREEVGEPADILLRRRSVPGLIRKLLLGPEVDIFSVYRVVLRKKRLHTRLACFFVWRRVGVVR